MSVGKFKRMLETQAATNIKTAGVSWETDNLAWGDAIWTECAELLDHIGWKWWKKQEPNIEQARIELIDIWHFGMSMGMASGYGIDRLADFYDSRSHFLQGQEKDTPTAVLIRELATSALGGHFNIRAFYFLMFKLGMTLDDLYSGYVGKNVLNMFRQNNGYKEGTYIKDWGGEEDNVCLARLVQQLDKDAASFPEELYEMLEIDYIRVKVEKALGVKVVTLNLPPQQEADKRFGQPHYGH